MILVFGGGLGNLVDRVAYGEVIDYLLFYYGQYHWPAFNLADSGITVGVGLMIVDLLRGPGSTRIDGEGRMRRGVARGGPSFKESDSLSE